MRRIATIGLPTLVLSAAWLLSVATTQAQMYRIREAPVAPYARGPNGATINPPIALSASRRPVSKPFANIQQAPTVSPYLNLLRNDNDGVPNYQTLVRPQLEQQAFNRRQELQYEQLNEQFQNFRAQSAYPISGSNDIRATGHSTRFMNLSHYYPQ